MGRARQDGGNYLPGGEGLYLLYVFHLVLDHLASEGLPYELALASRNAERLGILVDCLIRAKNVEL